ncbi:MAG: hypothetical protein HY908_14915 [Myxococcales bacterium]|nr:hypothetical protein [Myxococcales bacterium]
MKWLVATTTVSVLALGCAHAGSSMNAAMAPRGEEVMAELGLDTPGATVAVSAPLPERQPGDFAVYRVSGNYRAQPLTITQRVVDRQGTVLLMDITLDDGNGRDTLRLRVDDATGDLLSVAKLENGTLTPFGVAAYEEVMSKALLPADENQGMLKTEDALLEIGGRKVPVTDTAYRVVIGGEHATMHTYSSSSFGWGDLVGEIARDDGTVLYRAEIVSLGHDEPSKNVSTTARNDMGAIYAE